MSLGSYIFTLLLAIVAPIQSQTSNTELVHDVVEVDGDRLRGEILEITEDGVRFKTIYGEGELFIPFDRIERLTRDGIEQGIQDQKPVVETREPVVVVVTNVVQKAVSTNEMAESEMTLASPEGIDAQLEQMDQLQESWIERVEKNLGIQKFNKANDWMDEKLRLRMGLAYTAVGMYATDAPYGNQGAAAGDLDFFGRWRAWGQKSGNTGTIGFNLRHRHRYTETPPSQLNSAIGSPWNVTSGFDDSGFEVTQAYLDQYFLDRNVAFRIGQIYQDLHFDTYGYKSQKLFFLNAAFSDNPAVAFPGAGVGFAMLIKPIEDWYVISGVGDSQERKLDSGLDVLFSDKLFSGLEIGWAPSKGLLKNHSFSAFTWYSPSDSVSNVPDGDGFTLTYGWKPDQKNFSAFVRYAWSGSSATLAKRLVTGGLVFNRPFGIENDFFGVAVGWGDPTERQFVPPGSSNPISINGNGQGVLEVFHRFQITPLLQITPDVQLLIQPSYNLDSDVVAVFGLRARIAL